MGKRKVLSVKLLLFTGAIAPMFFDWCSYNTKGFGGDIMITGTFFVPAAFVLTFFSRNIYVSLVAFLLLIGSYIIPPYSLMNNLTFQPQNLNTMLSLCSTASKISFLFAITAGLFSMATVIKNNDRL